MQVAIRDLATAGSILDRFVLLDLKIELLSSSSGRHVSQLERTQLQRALEDGGGGSSFLSSPALDLRETHRNLWNLENRARELEAAGAPAGPVASVGRSIREVNIKRRLLRQRMGEEYVAAGGRPHLVHEVGADCYLDRLAIRVVHGSPDGNAILMDAAARALGVEIGILPEFARLRMVHERLTDVIARIDRRSQGGSTRDLYRSVYLLNDERHRVMASLRDTYRPDWWDVKEYPPYPIPVAWDQEALQWTTGA